MRSLYLIKRYKNNFEIFFNVMPYVFISQIVVLFQHVDSDRIRTMKEPEKSITMDYVKEQTQMRIFLFGSRYWAFGAILFNKGTLVRLPNNVHNNATP